MKKKDESGLERKFQRKSRAETLTRGGPGSAAGRAQEVINAHPNDPLRQMAMFMQDLDLQASTGRRRQVSHRTETAFSRTMKNAIQDLKKVRMPIQRIDQIGRSHALALTAYWTNELGHGASTIKNKLTDIRKFCDLIGKQGAIPKRAELDEALAQKGIDPDTLKRNQVTHWSKTWSSAGVNSMEVIARVEQENPHEALLFELENCFGLRVNEALSFRPLESERVNGVMVNLGTKGGKGRFVPFLQDEAKAARQRDVLERAKAWAQKHPKGEMGYERMSIEDARTKYYHELRKYGVNKKQMGVSSHGLRHEFAADYFEDMTGHRPPAEGQEPSAWFKENRALVEHAYKKVSEALGHWRKDISTAYLGSVAFMSKTQQKRIEKLIELFQNTEGVAQGLLDTGVERAWLTGRGASGVDMHHRERIELTVTLEQGLDMAVVLVEVQALLEKMLPGRVKVSPLLLGVQPDDGVEIFLD